MIDRRRFTTGGAATLALVVITGCGGGEAGSATASPSFAGPTPTPSPPPSPTASPTSTASPTPTGATTISPTALTIAFAGSSSPEQYLTVYAGGSDNAAVTASSDGRTFATLSTGAFGKSAGATIATASGRSVRFIRGGVGGSTLAQWAADTGGYRSNLVRSIVAAGGVDVLLLQVGRNDVSAKIATSVDGQAALLRKVIADVRRDTGLPRLQVFIGGTQDALGGDDVQHQQLGFQRQAEMMVANSDADVRYGFSTYDLATADGLHQNEASQMMSGRRFGLQVLAWLNGTAQVRGPRTTGAAAVDATTTDVTLVAGAGTDVTPATSISGFAVESGGRSLAIAAAVRLSSTVIRLTHASTGGAAATASYALAVDPDDAASVHDNSAERLPMEPSIGPLAIVRG